MRTHAVQVPAFSPRFCHVFLVWFVFFFRGKEDLSHSCPESISCHSCFPLSLSVSPGPPFTLLLVAARALSLLPP